MVKRSYGQYCGLAAALDVVGQRWALLIVRDLVPGPRRFTDLFQGLPGISTDLLADRLRSLEDAGVIQRTEVRHPAPASLYELRDRGRQLAHLAGDLARWGSELLPDPDDADDQLVNARWTLTQRAARYRGGFVDGDVHLVLDGDEELTLSFDGEQARLAYSHTPNEPRLRIDATTPAMLALLRSNPGDVTETAEGLSARGKPELLGPFVAALRF